VAIVLVYRVTELPSDMMQSRQVRYFARANKVQSISRTNSDYGVLTGNATETLVKVTSFFACWLIFRRVRKIAKSDY
jgi:hypothetical protein